MMPDPWATYKCPSASDNQAETTASSETYRIPADRGVLAQTRVFRGARLRTATRAPSTRSRGPNLTKEELQQRKRTEQEERLCQKKEEAWELYQRQPALMRKTRENFETKFREKVLGGIYSSSKDEQERDLQSWMNELEKVAQEEERRLEAFEKKRMDREDGQSRRRHAWDRIFQTVPKPFTMGQVTGQIDSLSDANGTDDNGKEKGKKVKGSWEDEDNVEASCWKKQTGGW